MQTEPDKTLITFNFSQRAQCCLLVMVTTSSLKGTRSRNGVRNLSTTALKTV